MMPRTLSADAAGWAERPAAVVPPVKFTRGEADYGSLLGVHQSADLAFARNAVIISSKMTEGHNFVIERKGIFADVTSLPL
jgi:hypothetical protein